MKNVKCKMGKTNVKGKRDPFPRIPFEIGISY